MFITISYAFPCNEYAIIININKKNETFLYISIILYFESSNKNHFSLYNVAHFRSRENYIEIEGILQVNRTVNQSLCRGTGASSRSVVHRSSPMLQLPCTSEAYPLPPPPLSFTPHVPPLYPSHRADWALYPPLPLPVRPLIHGRPAHRKAHKSPVTHA